MIMGECLDWIGWFGGFNICLRSFWDGNGIYITLYTCGWFETPLRELEGYLESLDGLSLDGLID